ncbi:hypothetical protein MD484_g4047, partial [Candolleomyces efflorescens]
MESTAEQTPAGSSVDESPVDLDLDDVSADAATQKTPEFAQSSLPLLEPQEKNAPDNVPVEGQSNTEEKQHATSGNDLDEREKLGSHQGATPQLSPPEILPLEKTASAPRCAPEVDLGAEAVEIQEPDSAHSQPSCEPQEDLALLVDSRKFEDSIIFQSIRQELQTLLQPQPEEEPKPMEIFAGLPNAPGLYLAQLLNQISSVEDGGECVDNLDFPASTSPFLFPCPAM